MSRLELVVEGLRGTGNFGSGVGWVGGSVGTYTATAVTVAFQMES